MVQAKTAAHPAVDAFYNVGLGYWHEPAKRSTSRGTNKPSVASKALASSEWNIGNMPLNFVDDVCDASNSPELHQAASFGETNSLSRLVAAGENVNVSTKDGTTALHAAVREGCIESARRLVQLGANLEARTAEGKTALHIAAKWGKTETVRMLLEAGADPTAKCRRGQTPLDWAFRPCIQELLKTAMKQNKKGRKFLH